MSIRSERNIEKQKKKARRAAPRKKVSRIMGNTLGAMHCCAHRLVLRMQMIQGLLRLGVDGRQIVFGHRHPGFQRSDLSPKVL